MDRKYIDDHHIVARYLANQLSDAEREAFEAHYLAHPQIVQELEATARFKVGLLRLRDDGQLDALIERPRAWAPISRLAIAACVAVIAVATVLWVSRDPSRRPMLVAATGHLDDRIGRPLPVAGSPHLLIRTRSAGYDAEFELPAFAAAIAVRVQPEFAAQPSRFRIRLAEVAADDTTHDVATLGALSPDANGYVAVYLNSSRLAPGRYQLLVSGETDTDSADQTSSFLIRVTSPTSAASQNK